ncbi:MAG: DUF2959 domain-containing protein [Pseudomonadales bacterium]
MNKVLPIALLLLLGACESAYYGAWEKVGVYKRDILRDRVEEAMASQEDAKEEFRTTLERFEAVAGKQDGALKSAYEDLQSAYDDADARASDVSSRIAAVEDVSGDLFDEWSREIGEISNPKLRASSNRQLQSSKKAYAGLLKAMRQAEARMQPVLTAFKDQVLFLKHNLNAQAIASLRGELSGIENDVARLIADMEEAIGRSQAFLKELENSGGAA